MMLSAPPQVCVHSDEYLSCGGLQISSLQLNVWFFQSLGFRVEGSESMHLTLKGPGHSWRPCNG